MDYWIYWGQTRLQWVAMAGWGNDHWLLLAIAESMLSLMAILVVCSRQLVRSFGQADNEVWPNCGVQQSIPDFPIPSGTVFSLQSLCSNCHSIDQLTSPATSKFSLQIVERILIHPASLIFRPPNSTEHYGTGPNRAKQGQTDQALLLHQSICWSNTVKQWQVWRALQTLRDLWTELSTEHCLQQHHVLTV